MKKNLTNQHDEWREVKRRLDTEAKRLCDEKGLRYARARLVALENLSRQDMEAFLAVMRQAREGAG